MLQCKQPSLLTVGADSHVWPACARHSAAIPTRNQNSFWEFSPWGRNCCGLCKPTEPLRLNQSGYDRVPGTVGVGAVEHAMCWPAGRANSVRCRMCMLESSKQWVKRCIRPWELVRHASILRGIRHQAQAFCHKQEAF